MRSIIKLILRILVVVVFLDLARLFLNYILPSMRVGVGASLSNDERWQYVALTTGLPVAFVLIVAFLVYYFLWRRGEKTANTIANGLDDNQLVINTSNVELYRVMMSLLGMYLLVTSVPNLIALAVSTFYQSERVREIAFGSFDIELERWIFSGVTALLGIWLLLGNRGIVKALLYAWNAGDRGKEEEKPE